MVVLAFATIYISKKNNKPETVPPVSGERDSNSFSQTRSFISHSPMPQVPLQNAPVAKERSISFPESRNRDVRSLERAEAMAHDSTNTAQDEFRHVPAPGEAFADQTPLLKLNKAAVLKLLKPISIGPCLQFVWVSLNDGRPLFGQGNGWNINEYLAGNGYIAADERNTGWCDAEKWAASDKSHFFQSNVPHACKLTTNRFPVGHSVTLKSGEQILLDHIEDLTERGRGIAIIFKEHPWIAAIQCWKGAANSTDLRAGDLKLNVGDIKRAFNKVFEFQMPKETAVKETNSQLQN